MTHPAEAVLPKGAPLLRRREGRAWLSTRLSEKAVAERASLLLLLGRIPRLQVAPWGYSIAEVALKDTDLEVRDAAIKALELWRGVPALKILEGHAETERWLADHLRRVVEELKREV